MGRSAFVSQAEYARMRNLSREAVNKRTATHGGPIPVHGPKKLINPAEADRLWLATMDGKQVKGGNSRARIPKEAPGQVEREVAAANIVERTIGDDADVSAVVAADISPQARARIASALIKAQTDRINLEKLKGNLIDKHRAIRQAFAFARKNRDAWLNWPARVGPELAASLGVDQHKVTAELERVVREHLAQLADEQFDPG